MDNDIEVIRQSLDLSNTIGEGLEYIKLRFEGGHFEETLILFQDVIQALISIQKAVQPIAANLSSNQLEPLIANINYSLEDVIAEFEKGNWSMTTGIIEQTLLPAYYKWQEELERCFVSHIAS
ncbi:MAG: hypothetical protein ABFD04_07505 [Syntrophomonas sp.]